MKKQHLVNLIGQHKSTRAIAKESSVSLSTVRYWLRKYNLNTKPTGKGVKGSRTTKFVCKCGETDSSKFYGKKGYICGKCHNKYTIERGHRQRLKVIEALGSKCANCGYNKYTCSLDIHHLDPSVKDPMFHHMRTWSWERIEREVIGKCILYCKNCHAAFHAGKL